mmetsp:Transcript_20990/g.49737  ORF Transcript_20990/g.49737 Transcript_20990/m.49737 type:complete len:303 (-) Transcript_20990:510-1418(-)
MLWIWTATGCDFDAGNLARGARPRSVGVGVDGVGRCRRRRRHRREVQGRRTTTGNDALDRFGVDRQVLVEDPLHDEGHDGMSLALLGFAVDHGAVVRKGDPLSLGDLAGLRGRDIDVPVVVDHLRDQPADEEEVAPAVGHPVRVTEGQDLRALRNDPGFLEDLPFRRRFDRFPQIGETRGDLPRVVVPSKLSDAQDPLGCVVDDDGADPDVVRRELRDLRWDVLSDPRVELDGGSFRVMESEPEIGGRNVLDEPGTVHRDLHPNARLLHPPEMLDRFDQPVGEPLPVDFVPAIGDRDRDGVV